MLATVDAEVMPLVWAVVLLPAPLDAPAPPLAAADDDNPENEAAADVPAVPNVAVAVVVVVPPEAVVAPPPAASAAMAADAAGAVELARCLRLTDELLSDAIYVLLL